MVWDLLYFFDLLIELLEVAHPGVAFVDLPSLVLLLPSVAARGSFLASGEVEGQSECGFK